MQAIFLAPFLLSVKLHLKDSSNVCNYCNIYSMKFNKVYSIGTKNAAMQYVLSHNNKALGSISTLTNPGWKNYSLTFKKNTR